MQKNPGCLVIKSTNNSLCEPNLEVYEGTKVVRFALHKDMLHHLVVCEAVIEYICTYNNTYGV